MINLAFNIMHGVRKWYWRTFNIKTFGTRAMLIDNQKVFLVKHRYGKLWVFPGGGLKKDESYEEVAKREVYEESGLIIKSFNQQLGLYKNKIEGKDDTLAIFVSTEFESGPPHNLLEKALKAFEVREEGWFPISDLPEGTSRATRERVREYIEEPDVFHEKTW